MPERQMYQEPVASASPLDPPYALERQPPRRRALGIVLILVGMVLLLFQLASRFVFGFGLGPTGDPSPLNNWEEAGTRIEISGIAADQVMIEGWSGNTFKIEALHRGGSDKDYTFDIQNNNGVVTFSGQTGGCFLFCARDLRFQVLVPNGTTAVVETTSGDIVVNGANSTLQLRTVSGSVQLRDTQGAVEVNTASGDVELQDVRGSLQAETISGEVSSSSSQLDNASVSTTSGDVSLDGAQGQVAVQTVSGNVDLGEANPGSLQISTTSGDISYNGSAQKGGTITTVSGDIDANLPQDQRLNVEFSTISGDVDTSNLEGSAISINGNADGPQLMLNTTSGDIGIHPIR